METTRQDINFGELAVRLAGYGLRTFVEFGLRGPSATVPGVGLSVEDFVWSVLSEYAEGRLTYEAERGELFSLLAKALRNDIIDSLRKAAHSREEARSPLPREHRTESGPLALDELPSIGAGIDAMLSEEHDRERLLEAFAEEPELAAVITVIVDLNLSRPREIAAELGISVTEYQNRKKRLRRRLVEYHAVEVREA